MQIPIFILSLKNIQNITNAKQIFQFCLDAIYLLALVFERATLCNWKLLDLQILYKFLSNLSKEIYYADLICFHYFCILLVESKNNNIKITLRRIILSSCCASLDWLDWQN